MKVRELINALEALPDDYDVLVTVQLEKDTFIHPFEVSRMEADLRIDTRRAIVRLDAGTYHPFF
jgi:hypothetical protein